VSGPTPAQVYRAYVEAEARRDGAALGDLLAPDIRIEVDGAPALASADEDRAAMAALFEAYPDYRREIIEIIESGDRAAARWRMLGQPRPDLAGRLPVIDIRGVSIVAVQRGRMTEAYVWSPGGALKDVLERLGELAGR
jgi:predicted ester cyclase